MGESLETPFAHLDYRCLALQNKSCSASFNSEYDNLIVFVFMSAVSVLTVVGNMAVIMAIAIFKHLHTPTNFIVLSLAVSDFLIGGLMIPLQCFIILDTCLHLGKNLCPAYHLFSSVLATASLINIVLVALDRYFALCSPFGYVAKMNIKASVTCVGFGWSFSLFYNLSLILIGASGPQNARPLCIGACTLPFNMVWGVIDFVFFFLIPCTLIIALYIRVLMVAWRHAKAISNASKCAASRQSGKSELKVTKTLGSVVLAYLMCWIPLYICLLNLDSFPNPSAVIYYPLCLFYSNSCINPVIYAISFPWFKNSVRLLVLHYKKFNKM